MRHACMFVATSLLKLVTYKLIQLYRTCKLFCLFGKLYNYDKNYKIDVKLIKLQTICEAISCILRNDVAYVQRQRFDILWAYCVQYPSVCRQITIY